jgi:hypothetical protein
MAQHVAQLLPRPSWSPAVQHPVVQHPVVQHPLVMRCRRLVEPQWPQRRKRSRGQQLTLPHNGGRVTWWWHARVEDDARIR